MSQPSALDRLARACGIEAEYHDIWGRPHRTERATAIALLRAMGIEADDDAAAERALAARERAAWLRALPPVLVVRRSAGVGDVELIVSSEDEGREHRWRIVAENGGTTEGVVVPAVLPGGEAREVDGRMMVRRRLTLTELPPPGYHRLEVGLGDVRAAAAATRLIVVPDRCHVSDGLAQGGRTWGPAVQVYALRGGRDWGAGDFTTLRRLVEVAAEAGAGIVGVNPLHALFPERPEQASPYSPSSRLFLNPLYVDVEAVPELAECDEARALVGGAGHRARRLALRERELVDWTEVAALKREVLERLWEHFRRRHVDRDTPRGRAFAAFRRDGGETLRAFAVFEALEHHFKRRDPAMWGSPVWPEAYRRPDSPAVCEFADGHADLVGYFEFLQFLADEQLGAVGRRSWELGLTVGLYQDLAVSVERSGFDGWWYGDVYALGAGVGAPPDDFNLKGQDWGLPPWIPDRLREVGYEPFIGCLRATMRHAGALRIDHVMALMRLFWIPPGSTPADGAYVRYPLDDLLGILALESVRNRCLVIGEDLGTVPDEIRERLGELGVLSYRLLVFMKDGAGEFQPPADYPRTALVSLTTHDLPTLAGWWQGADITLRTELDLFPTPELRDGQLVGRAEDRTRLLLALEREGLLPEGGGSDLAAYPEMTPELTAALHRYAARSPSMVLTVQLEDVLGQTAQVNLPGTTDQHPNWRRRLSLDVEALEGDERFRGVVAAIRAERGASPRGGGGGTPRIPSATYRLQLHGGFGFDAATAVVPYLAELGVSHVYCSPYLHARPGSTHGYDIIDHASLNPEIGDAAAFERFSAALAEHGMGQVADVVPNHMGIGSDNRWWMDVLEHGPASPHAEYFDIDWRPFKEALRGKVLLPVLEDHYGACLDRGLLRLAFDAAVGALEIRYHEHRFPVDPGSYPLVLGHGPERLRAALGADDRRLFDYESLVATFDGLPGREDPRSGRIAARLRDAALNRRRLADLVARSPEVAAFVGENVALFNGVAGDSASHDRLDRLLSLQAYRLSSWRVAADEINYRRFFDINDLAGLRTEREEVFEATHRLLLDLVRSGRVDGLRIDHPDGLYDPAGYARELAVAIAGRAPDGSPPPGPPVWVVVEKILAAHESLPDGWLVHGTTGYDFLNQVGGLFVDSEGEAALERTYRRFTGRRRSFERLVHDCKRLILDTALSSELTVLADELDRIAELDRATRDFTRERLRQALQEVIARFPVYRTYVTEDDGPADSDRRFIDWAVAQARRGEPAFEKSIFDFVHRVLTLDAAQGRPSAYLERLTRFVGRFQQLTGPVMAKGLEDTAFYIDGRLLCLDEVGGDPRRFGISVAAFHHANRERAERLPHAMLTTSTHDTKRGEDARVRIAALSEMPDAWSEALRRFGLINRTRRRRLDDGPAPSRNDEQAIYQTLLGAWPAGQVDSAALAELTGRVQGWAIKAVRESKVRGSWLNPNEPYETAVREFVGALLDPAPGNRFLAEFRPLARRVARAGAWSSIAQLVLKLTSPGVPDVYQGAELWELSLVDPDNRRPVDFELRRRRLAELAELDAVDDDERNRRVRKLATTPADGRIKHHVTRRLLRLRRSLRGCFAGGEYVPLRVEGLRADRLVAFERRGDGAAVVVVVPRLLAGLFAADDGEGPPPAELWRGTTVSLPGRTPGATLRDELSGGTVTLAAGADGAGFEPTGLDACGALVLVA